MLAIANAYRRVVYNKLRFSNKKMIGYRHKEQSQQTEAQHKGMFRRIRNTAYQKGTEYETGNRETLGHHDP